MSAPDPEAQESETRRLLSTALIVLADSLVIVAARAGDAGLRTLLDERMAAYTRLLAPDQIDGLLDRLAQVLTILRQRALAESPRHARVAALGHVIAAVDAQRRRRGA